MSIYIVVHIGAMILAVSFLGLAVRVARNKRGISWFSLHRIYALTGVSSFLLGLLVMVWFKSEAGYSHLTSPHAIAGASTIFMALVTPLGGLLAAKGGPVIRRVHRFAGRTTLGLAVLTILGGIIRVAQITGLV